jgi:hypothetical protein
MHINIMVCKGNMNFARGEKKWREPLARFPPPCPVRLGGGRRANPDYSTTGSAEVNKKGAAFRISERSTSFVIGVSLGCDHLAATELTVMVSPFKVPVTVAFLPACLSSVARAALSVVSRT